MRYLVMAMRAPKFHQSVIEAHKKYLAQLNEQVFLELAGPFTDKTGGAYLIAAKGLASAKAIAFNSMILFTQRGRLCYLYTNGTPRSFLTKPLSSRIPCAGPGLNRPPMAVVR